MAPLQITSIKDLDQAVQSVRAGAERTVRALRDLITHERDSLQVLRLMKFSDSTRAVREDRSLNLIEQVNQTLTNLLRLQAARWVLQQHSELMPQGIRLHLGSHTGFDLESVGSGLMAAEVFAANHPRQHDRLRKDVARLALAPGVMHRYVFFSCPGYAPGRRVELESVPGIELWSLASDHALKSLA